MARLKAKEKYAHEGWAQRHNRAVDNPSGDFEIGLLRMMRGWEMYAKMHGARYESKIGDDWFLVKYWQEIGESLRGLLNGELGRLDGGTLDAFILDTMSENGIDISQL